MVVSVNGRNVSATVLNNRRTSQLTLIDSRIVRVPLHIAGWVDAVHVAAFFDNALLIDEEEVLGANVAEGFAVGVDPN